MEPQRLDTVHPGHRRARRSGRVVRGVMAALALGLIIAVPAQAFTTTSRTNVPVAPTIYKVQGAHYDIGSAVTGPMLKPWVFQPGPVLYRVSGSGAQTVKVTYTVERWDGSVWTVVARPSGSVTIGGTVTSAKAPNLSLLPTQGSGYYRVKVAMVWTSQIGAVLGSMNVSMSASGDYTCSTTRTCSVGDGWVFIGA